MLCLFNSMGRKIEPFAPHDPNHVRMYVCGPTVYSYAHIGNARPAVVFDVLARRLRALFPRVTYARNITDVDDKIIAAATAERVGCDIIAARFTEAYHADLAALGVCPPDIEPLATDHIAQMIAMIEGLIAAGRAYPAKGHVLFHVPAFPEYGRLSGANPDEMLAGSRVEVAPWKRDPRDFVLWKPSKAEQPGWASPWGHGRPGWHIECSAMISAHLGDGIDIHGGGIDLRFPHHENEIAQGTKARFWSHNGHVTVSGGGGSVSWTPGVTFSGNVAVMGVPIDPRTQLPVPNNLVKTQVIVWVDFRFKELDLPVLSFTEQSIKQVGKLFQQLLPLV